MGEYDTICESPSYCGLSWHLVLDSISIFREQESLHQIKFPLCTGLKSAILCAPFLP